MINLLEGLQAAQEGPQLAAAANCWQTLLDGNVFINKYDVLETGVVLRWVGDLLYNLGSIQT